MAEVNPLAAELTEKWCANPYEIHKRPPFKAHSFDNNDRFYVVGSTRVAVLYVPTGREAAERIAAVLNNTPASRAMIAARPRGEG